MGYRLWLCWLGLVDVVVFSFCVELGLCLVFCSRCGVVSCVSLVVCGLFWFCC